LRRRDAPHQAAKRGDHMDVGGEVAVASKVIHRHVAFFLFIACFYLVFRGLKPMEKQIDTVGKCYKFRVECLQIPGEVSTKFGINVYKFRLLSTGKI